MESKYIIVIDVDQRDADYITIATNFIEGKPDRDTLIDLCIVENCDKLKDYDYEWYNLDSIQEYLHKLWKGFLYEPCNRFMIRGVVINGFDGDTNEWYTITDFSMDKLKELGITDIDAAYKERFFNDEDDF